MTMGLTAPKLLRCSLFLLAVAAVSLGVFLEDELPLELISTTPFDLNIETSNVQSVRLYGDDPLTAVFSRPVIALGSDFGIDELPKDKIPFTFSQDVPGRLYWVTSYIARFDPDPNWPKDLQLDLTWNADLTTYDGVKIKWSDPSSLSVKLQTNSIGASCEYYNSYSPLGLYVTDGRYRSDEEFLPDTKMPWNFERNVSLPLMQKAFKLFKEGDEEVTDIDFVVESCLPGGEIFNADGSDFEDTCLMMSFDKELERNTDYTIKFPAGSVYSTSGTVKTEEETCSISGPRNFELFVDEDDDYWNTGINNRRIQFLLNHGLAPDNTIDDVKKQIQILRSETGSGQGYESEATPIPDSQLDFTLTLEGKALATLSANLTPNQAYIIIVTGTDSVRDAFGFPLESQQVKFETSNWPQIFMQPNNEDSALSFESGLDWDGNWPIFTAGKGDDYEDLIQSFSYWAFPGDDEQLIENVLVFCTVAYYGNYYQESSNKGTQICNNLKDYLGEPDFVVEANNKNEVELQEINLGKLLNSGSGIVLYQQCCDEGKLDDQDVTYAQPTVAVMQRSISAYLIYKCSTTTATVVVWSLEDAKPVDAAEVYLYKISRDDNYDNVPSKVGSSLTDSNGFAKFKEIDWQNEDDKLTAVVKTSDGKLVLIDSLNMYQTCDIEEQDINLEGRVLVDHKLVRPEEGFYAAGYVRQLKGDAWEIPDKDIRFFLEFEEGLKPGGLSTVWLKPDADTGSFVVALEKAEDLKPDRYSIDLKAQLSDGSYETLDTIYVTGADPRAPTAVLTVTVPNWARPNSSFPVEVKTGSYIGASLREQKVKIQWEYYSEIQDEYIEGSFEVTTNDEGSAKTNIDLSELAPDLEAGDTFRLDFEYIGPVRECLTDARTVEIRESELSIELKNSLDDIDMPGIEFGSVASVDSTDVMTGEQKDVEMPVEIELIRSDGEIESTCTITSNMNDFSICRFTMQQVTNYTLSACAIDSLDQKICDEIKLGKSFETWQESPLSRFSFDWTMHQVKSSYNQGEEAELQFENPIPGSTLILYAHSDLGDVELIYEDLPQGFQTVPFKIDSFCYQNCRVFATLISPRQKSYETIENLPISKFFDPAGPDYFIDQLFITVDPPPSYIDINLVLSSLTGPQNSSTPTPTPTPDSTPTPTPTPDVPPVPIVVEPEEPVRLDVTSLLPGGTTVDAEILVFVVDRSILDVVPTPVVNVSEMVLVDLAGEDVEYQFLGNTVYKADALDIVRDFFLEANGVDPFLTPSMAVLPTDFVLPADKGLQRYLMDNFDYFRWINDQRPVPTLEELGESVMFLTQSADDASNRQQRDLDKIGEGVKHKEFRYLATPVQAILQTGEDGKSVIAFNAPINLGRFNIRAYASTNNNQFGVSELDFIVRRTLSLTISAPRQVRTQDKFQAGVIVTISPNYVSYFDDEMITVEIVAEPSDPIMAQNVGNLTATVAVVVGVPVEVGFQFEVESLGEGEIKFTATDSRGATDSRKAFIPVNGQQAPVTLASSFAIQGSIDGEAWQEGLVIPEAVEGSGSIDVSAGVGRLPAIQTYTTALMDDLEDDDPNNPSASKAISSVVLESILSTYNSVSEELSSASYKAMNDLVKLTKSDNGLCWYVPTSYFRAISISLNAWALWSTSEAAAYNQIPDAIQNLKSTWEQKMLDQLLEDAEYYRTEQAWRKPIAYPSISTLATVRLAVGFDWSPPSYVSDEIVDDLSVLRLYKLVLNETEMMPLGTQVDIALVAIGDGVNEGAGDVVSQVARNLLGAISVRARTAYITATRGSTSPADLETQSKALLFLLRNGNGDNPLVEKLANYIGSQKAYAYTTVAAALSLAEYDKVKESTNPDLQLDVRSGNVTMLKRRFRYSGDVVLNTTSFDVLSDPPQPIEFKATGVGEVSLAALLDFIPAVLYPFPQYRGIFVERIIQSSNDVGDATGPPLGTIPLKSVVNYVISMSTPFDVGAAEIQVLMPGGLEPVDPNIPTCQPGGNEVCYAGRSSLSFPRYYYPACPKMEVYPDKVIFKYAFMRAGAHDISFKAIAATNGNFVLPPVQAFSIQEPEILGLSASGKIEICENCDFVSFDALTDAPIACKNDCSGLGVCNVNEGVCICNVGSTGEDCSELVVS